MFGLKFNSFIFLIAIILENFYFGWNLVPKSDSEMICDLLCLIIFALV